MSPKYAPDFVDHIIEQWGRETPDLDVSSIAVLGRLHRCGLKYSSLIASVHSRYDLTTASFDVLTSLRRSGPPYRRTAGELAQTGLITTGGLSQRIDRLENSGLVERVREPGDRRVVHIQLTEAGLKLIEEVVEAHFAEQDRMLAGLTQTERKQLGKLLSRLEFSLAMAENTTEAPAD